MYEGTELPVNGLQQNCPGILACDEMPYDALMSVLPLFHVFSASAYPPAFKKYCRAFQHLSSPAPAPGRGSSGLHESGFRHFDPELLSLREEQIATITIVDDTFEQHRDIIKQAN
jgi:hypothetical protein